MRDIAFSLYLNEYDANCTTDETDIKYAEANIPIVNNTLVALRLLNQDLTEINAAMDAWYDWASETSDTDSEFNYEKYGSFPGGGFGMFANANLQGYSRYPTGPLDIGNSADSDSFCNDPECFCHQPADFSDLELDADPAPL